MTSTATLLDSSVAPYGSLPTTKASPSPNADTRNTPSPSTLFSWARAAGCFYLLIIGAGMTSEVALRGPLMDESGDDAQTFANLCASPGRLRVSLLLDAVMSISDVFVSLILSVVVYQAGANVFLTILAAVFRLLQQAVLMANLIHLVLVLLLVDPSLASYSSLVHLFDSQQEGSDTAANLAVLFLHLHQYGYAIAMIFFAGALLALGLLLLFAKHIYPQWLAVILVAAGMGYLSDSFSYFVVPNYNGDTALSQIFMLPVLVGEIGLAVILLVRPPHVVPSKGRVLELQ